jgi:PIN domain nuclease of toxin-antitoxin system
LAVVLDASAVLALLNDETGAETVERLLTESKVLGSGHTGLLSTVNLVEVQQYAPADAVAELLGPDSPISVVPFTAAQANIAADLFAPTREFGLSLADRSCLSLAIDAHLTAVTAEHVWLKVKLPIDVTHIRPSSLKESW